MSNEQEAFTQALYEVFGERSSDFTETLRHLIFELWKRGPIKPDTMTFSEEENPNHSHLRLQDSVGQDMVTLDLETGQVVHLHPESVEQSAALLWKGVFLMRNQATAEIRDFVIRGGQGRPGDVLICAGSGDGDGKGGSITMTPEE